MSMLEMDSERASNEDLAHIVFLLRNVSSKELKRRIEKFNDNYKNLDSQDIYARIKEVIMISTGAVRAGAIAAQEKEYFPGGIFYRARIWDSEFKDLPESEFWAAPNDRVKYHGRVNRPSQGLLYTSEGQIPTTFAEVRVEPQSNVLLMAYQSKEILTVATVGNKFYTSLPSDTRKKLSIIRKFINQNLLAAGEGAYLFSSEFTNSILNISPDGWAYPSTVYQGGENVCFRPESQHKLELLEIFAFNGKESGLKMPVGYFLLQEDGTYKYHAEAEAAGARFAEFIKKHRRIYASNDRSTLEQRTTINTTTRLIP
ncbi:RES domain-containing protein [Pseudomonas sp. MM213]|uniref:RES domain-containing protein n=1 Tax=Pseudomonas sp. MM213 TaxID=2866807 RepID=UPI001CF44ADF|nr:RES domain-containing protein [Pseudomonas sp. MM213]UCP11387.1 RES domain-containing protein [Pseudomonas sp. MM213]